MPQEEIEPLKHEMYTHLMPWFFSFLSCFLITMLNALAWLYYSAEHLMPCFSQLLSLITFFFSLTEEIIVCFCIFLFTNCRFHLHWPSMRHELYALSFCYVPYRKMIGITCVGVVNFFPGQGQNIQIVGGSVYYP